MRTSSCVWVLTILVCGAGGGGGCRPPVSTSPASSSPSPSTGPALQRAPIALTYFGVAGWQLDAAGRTLLVDPYFTRPASLDGPLVPDARAIAAHAPPRADLVLVGHSHADHALDVPAVALATGADVLGSVSTARYASAAAVPRDRIITVQGGEDFAFDGYSVRVLPSLHSALDGKHAVGGEVPADVTAPATFAQLGEGGTFAYLVRIAGQQVLFLGTANFIERELDGLRPDVAVLASGLRQEIHDYTCRLLRALGDPPVVVLNHFDDWRRPPQGQAVPDDAQAFVAEVRACSPRTRVIVPRPFERFELR